MKKIHSILDTLFLGLLLFPSVITAQGLGSNSPGIQNPLGSSTTLDQFIDSILTLVIRIGGIAALFFLIYAGFLFLKAQGKPAEIEKAKNTFLYTVIGIAILLGAKVLSAIIQGTVKQLQL